MFEIYRLLNTAGDSDTTTDVTLTTYILLKRRKLCTCILRTEYNTTFANACKKKSIKKAVSTILL